MPIVDKDGNFLLEANLRGLVRDECHTPLLVGGTIVAVDELQRLELEARGVRARLATPHELFNALTFQMNWLKVANAYLKTQIPHRDVVERGLDEAARRLRGG